MRNSYVSFFKNLFLTILIVLFLINNSKVELELVSSHLSLPRGRITGMRHDIWLIILFGAIGNGMFFQFHFLVIYSFHTGIASNLNIDYIVYELAKFNYQS